MTHRMFDQLRYTTIGMPTNEHPIGVEADMSKWFLRCNQIMKNQSSWIGKTASLKDVLEKGRIDKLL